MGEDGIAPCFQLILSHILFDLSHTLMPRPRVLLICSRHLFGESMETILRADNEVELVGPWSLGDKDIYERLIEANSSVIVIADENLQSEAAAELTKIIIEQCPDILVIRAGLSENVFRIVSTHTLPARGDNLLETIRTCVTRSQESARFDES
jgi:DNA-binding NarL/FixJ family response regulator